ncbi:hypothetical protein BDZ89DRAFT_271781 [Hymenopellis radicata]|nr:hypothetical protein BDZ89DRAFT_271781 [Hymenopellis radicata]
MSRHVSTCHAFRSRFLASFWSSASPKLIYVRGPPQQSFPRFLRAVSCSGPNFHPGVQSPKSTHNRLWACEIREIRRHFLHFGLESATFRRQNRVFGALKSAKIAGVLGEFPRA